MLPIDIDFDTKDYSDKIFECLRIDYGFKYLSSNVLGPDSSRACKQKYDKNVVKNGQVAKAVIVGKNTHKGNSVIFKYSFNGNNFKNREQNDTYFEDLHEGDTVIILLDSTHPSKSFITSY